MSQTERERLLAEVVAERFGDPRTAESERPRKGSVLPPPRKHTNRGGRPQQ